MNQTKVLFVNVFASHLRSVFVLFCGLLTGRWALQALGTLDYGLLGLVGGLVACMSFVTTVLSTALVRFFSSSIGEGDVRSIDDCRHWFNVALCLHLSVPTILLVVGYPVGIYLIKHFLVIPAERLLPCVWVFRFSCMSCFIGMVTVPFQAIFTARQRIAELSAYNVVSSALHVIALYVMISCPGDWLVGMAGWQAFLAVLPRLIIVFRARSCFPECSFVKKYMFDRKRMSDLFKYVGWQTYGSLGMLVSGQGVALVVNKCLGSVFNASCTVANTVSCHGMMFANGVNTAFEPAIISACGAGLKEKTTRLVECSCKFGALLAAGVMIPLCLEMEYVLTLWLKNPPPQVTSLSIALCVMIIVFKTTFGHEVAIRASGRIALEQFVTGSVKALNVLFTWLVFSLGFGFESMGVVFVASAVQISTARLFIARHVAGIFVVDWLRKVFVPLAAVCVFTILMGMVPQLLMSASFVRLLTTGFCCCSIMSVTSWTMLFSKDEKDFVKERILARLYMSFRK